MIGPDSAIFSISTYEGMPAEGIDWKVIYASDTHIAQRRADARYAESSGHIHSFEQQKVIQGYSVHIDTYAAYEALINTYPKIPQRPDQQVRIIKIVLTEHQNLMVMIQRLLICFPFIECISLASNKNIQLPQLAELIKHKEKFILFLRDKKIHWHDNEISAFFRKNMSNLIIAYGQQRFYQRAFMLKIGRYINNSTCLHLILFHLKLMFYLQYLITKIFK